MSDSRADQSADAVGARRQKFTDWAAFEATVAIVVGYKTAAGLQTADDEALAEARASG